MKTGLISVLILISAFAGCGKPWEQAQPLQNKEEVSAPPETVPSADAFKPFYVFQSKGSRENHYVPSGFMPNGNCVEFTDTWQENCQTGGTCLKIVYDVECSRGDQKWAGIYWLNPANNWGTRKGGYDLRGAKKLTFWARGEKGGEQVQEFTVGGISGDYPDTDTAVIGPVILGTQWRQYTIDLRGKDLSYISGGFSWTSSEEVNPESCTFFLDDIRFE
ncbi:MAG: hypothetical protein JW847_03750 [Candidatus Omnitrophica bacterium]|nr:hypothetical protein [Candidatus Omnitrophota bacterium]